VLAQRAAVEVLSDPESVYSIKAEVLAERARLEKEIANLGYVREVISSEANFLIVRVNDADKLYLYLMERGIIVRNRTHEPFLEGALRITIGSKEENAKLMEALCEYSE
ncbi:MAG: aminotransferase class I/II-fold pyridoxal phosphate-dependent enzyme, partial [Spirochaetales bacterium]|nr:aminotransferase class I/II-fold pyridoxal phosphate-dependent enzyme [Spirochaetales bacterium]